MLDRMLLASTASEALYVEDVFSTWLYTGNGSTQTITNGIDLAGKGGLVWLKSRSGSGYNHVLTDTVRGVNATLVSNSAAAQFTASTLNWAFSSSGFSFNNSFTDWNANGATYASWTFRKAPKFFDVVTYTGNSANRTIAHSLGVAPGAIIVKRTDTTADWVVYNRGLTSANNYLWLNRTDAEQSSVNIWNGTAPTSTEFSLGSASAVNASGGTYVAYLFAHDATADGIIQCGSYTGNGSDTGPVINLGWEPQWLMVKRASGVGNWLVFDTMRGMPVSDNKFWLRANTAEAEIGPGFGPTPNATGFQIIGGGGTGDFNVSGQTYVYIAIRRGPMKTPTVGTSVFAPVSQTPSGVTTITTNFPVDMTWLANRDKSAFSFTADVDRLRGTTQTSTRLLATNTTDAESTVNTYGFGYDRMTSITDNYSNSNWGATTPVIYWNFRRAPGFFDVVCYTGTGGTTNTFSHNLGVAPQLVIIKSRSAGGTGYNWPAITDTSVSSAATLLLNNATGNLGGNSSGMFSATTVNIGSSTGLGSLYGNTQVNASGVTYVAYLFASTPGVSKVGSYTGNGSSQTINCGFSSGARFFLVKRTDSTGDWWVYDSARGIVAAADPALRLNSTAAEVTSADAVDTDSTGIIVNQETTCNINVNGATYIYLAIA